MKYRTLGKTGFEVSEISFGAWAIGGTWGDVNDKDSMAALHALSDDAMRAVRSIYDNRIFNQVHHQW